MKTADTRERLELIERNTEEILTRDDMYRLLDSGTPIRHYIGFEISGAVHLGTGLICMSKVRDFLEAGLECSVLLADWHTWINEKLSGDPQTITKIANGYFREALSASLRCLGANPDRVDFVLASDLYRRVPDYWPTVVEVSKNTSLARVQRSISILGRKEGESADFSKLLYPVMQVADIFALGVHVAHSGLDQRKAHVIARDVAPQLQRSSIKDSEGKTAKPVAVHHPLLLGLGKPPTNFAADSQDFRLAMKMSKSAPNSAIFIHDSPEEIHSKIRKAYCPPGNVAFNPIMDWAKQLVFGVQHSDLAVARTKKRGTTRYTNSEDLDRDYSESDIHPMDLKDAVAESIVDLLGPVREEFETAKGQALLAELKASTPKPGNR